MKLNEVDARVIFWGLVDVVLVYFFDTVGDGRDAGGHRRKCRVTEGAEDCQAITQLDETRVA
jgi:hypothetical protein